MSQKQRGILLVAHYSTTAQTLTTLLTNNGYTVRTAPDGASALVMAKAVPPNIILLRVNLPTMTGYEVCQQLQAAPRTKTIPIILLYAAEATTDDKAQGLAHGATDYIIAPFCETDLLHRIAQNLHTQQLQATYTQQQQTMVELVEKCEENEQALEKVNAEVEHWINERMAALRASEAMFRYFLSQANDGYLIVSDDNEILYTNAQARLYLGLQEETLTPPQNFITLAQKQYHCEPQLAWSAWPKKTFFKGTPIDIFLVRPESDTASAFWLKVTLLDVPAGMETTSGRIIRMEDVTERTALQDELNKFHALIAHKLRTPLVPIYSGLQYVTQNIAKLTTDDITDFLGEALNGAERLYNEIEDIVQYLNAPDMIKNSDLFALTNLPSLIADIAQNLDLQTITTTLAPALHNASISLAAQSIELILWELLENSKKFHPTQSPTVQVQVRPVGTQEVCLQITDDGIHLSPTQLMQMWIPYYQGEKLATGQVIGMGLGLPLVTMQVWGAGGTCRAHNREDGLGIVVEIKMPLQHK